MRGIVDDVELAPNPEFAASPEFLECIEASTASLLLDPPEGGGRVRVNYPFVFRLDDE